MVDAQHPMNFVDREQPLSSKKAALSKIRYDGYIPAVIYRYNNDSGEALASRSVMISSKECDVLFKKITVGDIGVTPVQLVNGEETINTLIKGIEYEPINYKVLHLDFMPLDRDCLVKVRVPVKLKNTGSDCKGVKAGGKILLVNRTLLVQCSSKAIPSAFHIDMKDVDLKESVRISDMKIPNEIRVMAVHFNDAVVVVDK